MWRHLGLSDDPTISKAGLRDAAIGTGIAVDKMLALTGQTPASVAVAVVPMPTEEERAERRRIHDALDGVALLLRQEEPLTSKEELLLNVHIKRLELTNSQDKPGELPPISNAQH